jgi:hypothetical protein
LSSQLSPYYNAKRVPKLQRPNFITKYFGKFPGKSVLLDIYCDFFIFSQQLKRENASSDKGILPGYNAPQNVYGALLYP